MKDKILKIEKKIWSSFDQNKNIGLFTGLSGIILFYDYLNQAYPEQAFEEKLMTIIENSNQLIEQEVNSGSLCSGFAGYGITLLRLKNKSIEIDEDYFDSIDSIILDEFQHCCETNKFDFLHEAMGMAMYFIERYKQNQNQYAFEILNDFSRKLISKVDTDFQSILMKSGESRGNYYSFGIAHGVASYLNFLIYLKNSIEDLNVDISISLQICIDFLMSFKKYDMESKQFFPNSFLLETNQNIASRLSWCQGDLGISNALFNTGVFLNDEELMKEAVFLMNKSSKLKFNESGVNDISICHGSAGIIIQYYLASKKYNIDYTSNIEYWFQILEKQTDNFEKFLCYDNLNKKYKPEINLLLGAAGLGLTLLTLENKIDAEWLETLNLH